MIFHVWLWGNKNQPGKPGECVGCRTPVIAEDGYRVIWSRNDYWYLDHMHKTWDSMYEADPCQHTKEPLCSKKVLGGETCMWTEHTDEGNLFDMIWPRAGSVAEKLWSSKEATGRDSKAMLPRFKRLRCTLVNRGIGAHLAGLDQREGIKGPGSCLQ